MMPPGGKCNNTEVDLIRNKGRLLHDALLVLPMLLKLLTVLSCYL